MNRLKIIIPFFLLTSLVILLVYQPLILTFFMNFFGKKIILDLRGAENGVSKEIVLEISDMKKATRKSTLQGGATLVMDFERIIVPGEYTLLIRGKTEGETGKLIVGLYNSKTNAYYTYEEFFGEEERDMIRTMELDDSCDQLYVYWDNDDSMPIISQFYIYKKEKNY